MFAEQHISHKFLKYNMAALNSDRNVGYTATLKLHWCDCQHYVRDNNTNTVWVCFEQTGEFKAIEMSRSVECKHQVVVGGSESRLEVSGVMAELQMPISYP